jgi:hypothetical protein
MADAPDPIPNVAPVTAPLAGVPSTSAEAAARLRQMTNDPKWREGLLAGSPQIRQEFERLTQQVASGDGPLGIEVETVDAVTDPHALSRAAYSGLIVGLREQGLPEASEQYIRDLDSGRRTDRPSGADGIAARQALDRLGADFEWRQRYLNGDIRARNLFNALNRIVAFAADDSEPISPEIDRLLVGLGFR